MRVITKDEFNELPIVNGIRQCPGGTDYRAIQHFGDEARFGDEAVFGDDAHFGDDAAFGEGAVFGDRAVFGNWAVFGDRAHFGINCIAESISWAFVYAPPLSVTGRIYPPKDCRTYWEKRLGLALPGCYEEIYKLVAPQLDAILGRPDLTEMERAVLKSWRI